MKKSTREMCVSEMGRGRDGGRDGKKVVGMLLLFFIDWGRDLQKQI